MVCYVSRNTMLRMMEQGVTRYPFFAKHTYIHILYFYYVLIFIYRFLGKRVKKDVKLYIFTKKCVHLR